MAGEIDSGMLSVGSSLVTNAANIGLSLYQDKVNYARFLENRNYNSPANQIQRLIDAGVNPNSAAGGTSIQSASSDSPPMSPPFAQAVDSSNIANSVVAQSAIDLNKAQEAYYKSQTVGLDIENSMKPFLLDQTLRKAQNDNKLSEQTLKFNEENNGILLDLNRESVNQIRSNIKVLDAQSAKLYKEKDLIEQEIKTSKSVEDLNNVLRRLNLKEISVKDAQIANLDAQTDLTKQQRLTEVEETDKRHNEALSAEKDFAIKSVQAYFATEEKLMYQQMGFTPSMQDVYTRAKSIEQHYGKRAADDFIEEMLYLTTEQEAAVNAMKFYFSEHSDPTSTVVNPTIRAQAGTERVARQANHRHR